ncbi:hypothetical protein BDA96_10G127600 [Sorghum bicolor]|uniref:RING-type domain-containing protein n=2 Tax=Sorghum bicolor TaxID=4558 RepID=A0A194YIB5_SORBI|nr:E3 ubiquitin-protein ligase NEURL3 [Sorghum bicolor]KAG0513732.1 hypothetical protein BDA96_10G127600 [Sorghum bicolor]KXG19713.1 hypothetical protein SORBI_3010G104200 [Sorghum bicolor]KXG19714.1 hypothetical protein SORBI_3010G104200 [Sorghum bicolor]OQU76177.1 hypothetical protein SORBI_3010G104200 [Sorghum bicolor]OQU76178.1 hypothetical protein SORBI_3010G104200 [Sorghum bicolor]|eukprot:XP_021304212.1 E3 ubiquitin-protein ligase NEURL3 [Sorghum bicolor]
MNVLLIAMVSFASQWFTCLMVAVVLLAMLYCFLKQLAGNADAAEQEEPIRRRQDETEPILPRKEVFFSYGATEEHQPECSASCPAPAEDPLSEKMCRICYDSPRSCFLIPCGHCFTCFTCARRIVEEESKACPICRRLIHRVRRLESP